MDFSNFDDVINLLFRQNNKFHKDIFTLAQQISTNTEDDISLCEKIKLNLGLNDVIQSVFEQIRINAEVINLHKSSYLAAQNKCVNQLMEQIKELKESIELNKYFMIDTEDFMDFNIIDNYESKLESKEQELAELLLTIEKFKENYRSMSKQHSELLQSIMLENSDTSSSSSDSEEDSSCASKLSDQEELNILDWLSEKEPSDVEEDDLIIPKGFFWQDNEDKSEENVVKSVTSIRI